jgi:undecaprenyl-diphosphatase
MKIFEALTLGTVQGLTEFIPVSSSAHLSIVPRLLGWGDFGVANTAVIQLGTLIAVLIYFGKDIIRLIPALFRPGPLLWVSSKNELEGGDIASPDPEKQMAWGVILGTIPIVVIGLAFKVLHLLDDDGPLRKPIVTAGMLIIMGAILYAADMFAKKNRGAKDLTIMDSIWIGLAQCIALIPGASRSGSTLTGAFAIGLDRETAARFSFLLSVPAILLSGLLELKDVIKPDPNAVVNPNTIVLSKPELGIATVVAGIVGYVCIAWLIKFLSKSSTLVFVLYRIVFGLILLFLAITNSPLMK